MPTNAPFHFLDLDAEAEALLTGLAGNGRRAKTLRREGGTSLVLIAMAAGNLLDRHSAPGVVTVQVLRGAVAMTIDGAEVELAAQQAVMMQPGVLHDVLARVPSVILLTISGGGE